MSDRGSWNALLSYLASGAGCEISGEGGTSTRQNSSLGGMSYVARRKGDRLCVQGVRTPPPDDTERASLSGATPSGFPKMTRGALPYPDSLREKHMALAIITPRTIAYPIRIRCLDHWLKCTSLATSFRQPATAHVLCPLMVCLDALSGHLLQGRLNQNSIWVESVRPCHGFQKTLLNLGLLWWSKSYQNTKT